MKRINFRPIFYSFISLGLGIYFAKLIFALNLYVLLTLGIGISILIYLCVKYKCIKRLLIIISSFAIGLGMFLLSCTTFNNNSFKNGTYMVSGRISIVNEYSNMTSVVLDKTYINGEYVNKNIIVSLSNGATMEEGYVITFTGRLEKTQLFSLGKFNNYYYKYGIAYTSSITENDYSIDSFKGLTISERLRKSVKNVLDRNMNSDQSSISYASLFGDKTYVNDSIKENFSISGIAHLLAVSGLHIGFVTTLLLFVLNRTKLKKYINLIIISVILVFYCYLCSFSISVVRASIMFIVLSFAGILGKQYDRLNSIGIAGIIVLIYKPLSVYDAGFLLSFASVFSIFMFANLFKNIFEKIKFLSKISDTLSVMLSVQLGLLPLTIYYYGQISLLTLLANFICIPVFEVYFILLFVLVPLVLCAKFLVILLKIPAIIITSIINIAQIVASQKWAIINLSKISPIFLVGIYFSLFIFSHFVNYNKKQKLWICSAFVLIFLLISLGITTPVYYNQNIAMINAYGKSCYIVELGGTTFCVGNYNGSLITKTNDYFDNVVYKKADYIIIENNYKLKEPTYYKNVYNISENESEHNIVYNEKYILNNVNVTPYKIADRYCGIMFIYNNVKIFIGSNKLNFDNLYNINYMVGKLDIFIDNSNCLEHINELNISNYVKNGNYIKNDNSELNMEGNWTFNYSNGKINNIRSID